MVNQAKVIDRLLQWLTDYLDDLSIIMSVDWLPLWLLDYHYNKLNSSR